ncbi:hypothetical protein CR513_14061, partial [Mucuna pruriens]
MDMTLIERVRCMLSEESETLYTTLHVINLSPTIPLNIEVLDKIWFGKDVKYDHLRVFDCKAFVHVRKDERSKLDMKTRHCIFIGYGQDEYGYRLYVPIVNKLVKSRDVQFMEDQTIEDIDKVKNTTLEKDNSLFEIDPVRMPVHDLDTTKNNVQNGEQHNYLGYGFDVPPDDDAKEEQEMSQDENLADAPKPPPVQLRRSNRKRQSSTRYTSDEYVTLKDGEELECYQEAMESEEKQKWLDAMQDKIKLEKRKTMGVAQKELAPRQWYKKFESVMCEQGYKKTTFDHYVLVRKFSDDDFIILLLYVEDMLIIGKTISKIDRL